MATKTEKELTEKTYFLDKDIAWERVTKRVDYPVKIVPGYFPNQDGGFDRAYGKTNGGKNNEFNFVVVDVENSGKFVPIASANGVYDTLVTKEVYQDLKKTLDIATDGKYTVHSHYMSANGGNHQLMINLDHTFLNVRMEEAVQMQVALRTSVDCSKGHSMVIRAYDKKRKISIQLPGAEFNLNARHTNTISERTIDFHPFIDRMIKSWDDTIMPMMALLCDEKFDRELAINMLEELMAKTDIAAKHIKSIKDEFRMENMQKEEVSMYDINLAIQGYISKNIEPTTRDLSDKIRKVISQRVFAKLRQKK